MAFGDSFMKHLLSSSMVQVKSIELDQTAFLILLDPFTDSSAVFY
jgi:hypothetical protein